MCRLLVLWPLPTASSTSSLAHYCCWPTYVWHIVNVVLASSMRLAVYHASATATARPCAPHRPLTHLAKNPSRCVARLSVLMSTSISCLHPKPHSPHRPRPCLALDSHLVSCWLGVASWHNEPGLRSLSFDSLERSGKRRSEKNREDGRKNIDDGRREHRQEKRNMRR